MLINYKGSLLQRSGTFNRSGGFNREHKSMILLHIFGAGSKSSFDSRLHKKVSQGRNLRDDLK